MTNPDWGAFAPPEKRAASTLPPPRPPAPPPVEPERVEPERVEEPSEPDTSQAAGASTTADSEPTGRVDRPPGRARRSRPRPQPAVEEATHPTPAAVWIPSELHEQLRARAARQQQSKTALFLDSFEAAYEQLRAGRSQATPRRSVLPPRPTRRRGRVDRGTQLSLYLTVGEREVIDGLAAELSLSRSALVTRVLELALDERGRQPA